jgi:glucan 1,3-beta-glucosidase
MVLPGESGVTLMDRRDFMRTAVTAGAAFGFGGVEGTTARAQEPFKPAGKWRGVNLGGWLALEKWITPSVYAGVDAEDEFTLCQKLGKDKAAERLKRHRETWVTDDDFKWLAAHGINAVRLPVNYGVAEENPPFVSGMETVDRAFRSARKHGIGVVLDLHGVPGSQNGWDHSGRQGTLGWHTSKENIDHSLRIIRGLAERCKGYDNLIGFELLNEPRWDVPLDILKAFYRDAYRRVREHIPPDRAAVVIHDAFRHDQWAGSMKGPGFENVMLDTHPYQCFTDDDRKRDLHGQVVFALTERKKLVDGIRRQLPCVVGEWSCALPPESLKGLGGFGLDVAMRAYGDAQLVNYDTARGWFFWTYRTESGGAWSFRDCVKRGWLPERYDV